MNPRCLHKFDLRTSNFNLEGTFVVINPNYNLTTPTKKKFFKLVRISNIQVAR